MTISSRFAWSLLTPEPGHFTFGYYDRNPWDAGIQRHLALRIPQQSRLPEPGETADVGYVSVNERQFVKLAETRAWCHQQGAMTLWLRHQADTFIYNDFEKTERGWQGVARIYNIRTGPVGNYDVPIYTTSMDGRWGAALNFNRIPRRGYSYALAPMPFNDPEPDWAKDGLSIADMHSGEVRLIASYRQLLDKHPFPYDVEGKYVWLNHSIFNCDASRVMVLFRYSDTIEAAWPWRTFMYTMKLDGSDLRCSLTDLQWSRVISHQMWGRTPGEILVDANWGGRGSEYIVFNESQPLYQAQRISKGMGPAGHLIFSPDGKCMAADTYPDKDGIQRLALVNCATGEFTELGQFMHQVPDAVGDVRCDLHPRWSPDGRWLTVDSIHSGERKIHILDMHKVYPQLV